MTKMVDLAFNSPNVLCQNLTTLTPGMYQLNFSVYNDIAMYFSEIKVLLNNRLTFRHVT